jgi:Flp pilus assembly protein TadD
MSGDVMGARELAVNVYEGAQADVPLVAAEALSVAGQACAAEGDTVTAARSFKQAVFVLTGVGADREAAQLWLELGSLLESVGEDDAARSAYRSAAASMGLRERPRANVWSGR